jgi:hypothetical protein
MNKHKASCSTSFLCEISLERASDTGLFITDPVSGRCLGGQTVLTLKYRHKTEGENQMTALRASSPAELIACELRIIIERLNFPPISQQPRGE